MSAGKCLYPGSFDPVTLGHVDIIRRAAGIFDEVIVGVLHNPDKRGCFPVEKRLDMLRRACVDFPNVRVIAYAGLMAECCREYGVTVAVRGVRGAADLEAEAAMAHINRRLNPALETLLLPALPEHVMISASLVRQLAMFHADISAYVPPQVVQDVRAAFDQTEP